MMSNNIPNTFDLSPFYCRIKRQQFIIRQLVKIFETFSYSLNNHASSIEFFFSFRS